MKTLLILVACVLAILAWFVVVESPPLEPVVPSTWDASGGPRFEVHVVKPRSARALGGLLPDGLFGLPPHELQFDHQSTGAASRRVDHDRLELTADGWELLIEIDSEGALAPGTRLVFPLELGGQQRTLRCRPADQASGYLRTTERADSDVFDGLFLVEFAACELAESGKTIDWPSAPLTVHGSFQGLPPGPPESPGR